MIHRMRKSPPRSRGLVWALLVLAASAAVVAYYYVYPERLPQWVSKTPLGRDLQSTTVYKWRDASGAWHVSDRPPAGGVEFEVESYARDTNILPLPPELQDQ